MKKTTYLFTFLIVLSLSNVGMFWKKDFIEKLNSYKNTLRFSPKYVPVNYLNYVPNVLYQGESILFKNEIVPYFNEAGYRGEIVPIERDRSKLRILFLGASTTILEGGGV